jgi:hypothetical protein
MCERSEQRPIAAVTDDRGGLRGDALLRDPALDPDIGRQRIELGGIALDPGRDEHAHYGVSPTPAFSSGVAFQ